MLMFAIETKRKTLQYPVESAWKVPTPGSREGPGACDRCTGQRATSHPAYQKTADTTRHTLG